MKDLPNVETLRAAADVKPTTAADARDKILAKVLAMPEEQRDIILHTADKLLDLVTQQPLALHAFTLANAELAALHEAGLLESRVIVPT